MPQAAPRLLATSDIHVSHRANREALAGAGFHPDDWLIIAGDVGEKPDHLRWALDLFLPRFARVLWTPGNHDLWCPPGATDRTRGHARYGELVAICRAAGVITPEDPFVQFPGAGGPFIVPMFLLFDYSFRPPEIGEAQAIPWARESGVGSGDEQMLSPEPDPTIAAWCHARCEVTAARLDALPADARTVLINHWPLRYDLARPPRVPRFSIWSGTTRTEDWALRYRALAVVTGHLHFRTTMWRHGVRYEEVSLGYPRDWQQERGFDWYLRQILPAGSADAQKFVPPRDPFR
ncbi:MAG TPA: metallophosphoesterase [Vicinamibacterales bacterium]|nr:metallophosphoesterase [Vicinamibacterales bacterium]